MQLIDTPSQIIHLKLIKKTEHILWMTPVTQFHQPDSESLADDGSTESRIHFSEELVSSF